jgi:hypothetical protein
VGRGHVRFGLPAFMFPFFNLPFRNLGLLATALYRQGATASFPSQQLLSSYFLTLFFLLFFFDSVYSSPAVPVTLVSNLFFSPVSRLIKSVVGSHIVHVLQETRRYKVVSIDNFHNSYPRAFSRLEELTRRRARYL